MTSEQAYEVPLVELLQRVPVDARLIWEESDGLQATHFVPIGSLAHKAAQALTDLREALQRIAEGNLGQAPWQANYETIRNIARTALSIGE